MFWGIKGPSQRVISEQREQAQCKQYNQKYNIIRNKIETLLSNGGVSGGRQGESKRQDFFITVQNGLNLTISHSKLNIRRTKAMDTYSS